MQPSPGPQELRAAYEGPDSHFEEPLARERYRAALLAKATEQADFPVGRLRARSNLEGGCGNGRLLIELARRGAVTSGLGIDVARSRVAFARDWARDLDLGNLAFEAADAVEMPTVEGEYDAIICITGA